MRFYQTPLFRNSVGGWTTPLPPSRMEKGSHYVFTQYLFAALKITDFWFLEFTCVLLIIKITEGLETFSSWFWGTPLSITHILGGKFWHHTLKQVKGTLSGLRLATESSLKMMKNAVYFPSKALFVLIIFRLLSWLFARAEKRPY